MPSQPSLIIQVPSGSAVERTLEESPPPSLASGLAVMEVGPTDSRGTLEAAAGGEVVLSVPSPEALVRDAGSVMHVIGGAGTGAEPILIEVEAAEEIREEELAVVVEASARSPRPVIMRVIRGA